MWNSLEDIIKEKKLLENNREMLLKTMGEMLSNRGNKGAINEMVDDILDLGKRINKLDGIINVYEETDEPSYEYYGKECKDTNFCSTRDTIEKLNEWKQKIDSGEIKPSICTRLEKDGMERRNSQLLNNKYKPENNITCTNIPLYDNKITVTDKNSTSSYVNDVMNENYIKNLDKCTKSNRFLVHMLNIPSDMVCSVEMYSKKMILQMYNFINDVNEPIYINLGKIKENDRQFDITIEFLDSRGEVMYKEIYKDCRIDEINRSALDYSSDDFTKNDIYLTYNEVVFEKPEIQKRKRSNKVNENHLKEEDKPWDLQ